MLSRITKDHVPLEPKLDFDVTDCKDTEELPARRCRAMKPRLAKMTAELQSLPDPQPARYRKLFDLARFFVDYIEPYLPSTIDISPYISDDVMKDMRSLLTALENDYNKTVPSNANKQQTPFEMLVSDIDTLLPKGTGIEKTTTTTCADVLAIPQFGGTCWFNASLMMMLYSQKCREVIGANINKWGKPDQAERPDALHHLRRWFVRLLTRHFTGATLGVPEDAYKMLSIITPNTILRTLFALDHTRYEYDVGRKDAGWNQPDIYMHNMFRDVLAVNAYTVTLYNRHEDNGNIAYHVAQTPNYKEGNKPLELRDVDVILCRFEPLVHIVGTSQVGKNTTDTIKYGFESEYHIVFDRLGTVVTTGPSAGKINLKGDTFDIDAAYFTATGHAVAGITCNGKRYIYNGWSSDTKDPAQIYEASSRTDSHYPELGRPCPLMEFDWLTEGKTGFCPNSKCSLTNETALKYRCFSTSTSLTRLIATRTKKTVRESVPTNPRGPPRGPPLRR
jgi:hypothetical protein